jgi:hypothetical protein
MSRITNIQIRKGTSTDWTSANPVLSSGEPGYDVTTKTLKIGDGSTAWSSLTSINLSTSNITNFNSSVSGLLNVKSLVGNSGIGIVNSAGVQTISITGIPSSLITDLGNIATTQVVGRTGIALTYDSVSDFMYIDTTGVSLTGHSHTWNNISDASTKATLAELTYLSGVTAGTASASRALVVDSSKNLTGLTSLNGSNSSNPISLSYCVIDGGSP